MERCLISISRLVWPVLRLLWVKKVKGVERIPLKGSLIIVANHNSDIDGLLLCFLVAFKRKRWIRFFMFKKFFERWIGRLFFGFFLKQIPANGAFEKGLEVLWHSGTLGIFPEGRRSDDGKLQRVKRSGLGALSLLSGSPVVPVGIKGTFEVWSRHKSFPKLFFARKVEINIGKAMWFGKKERVKKSEAMQVVRKVMREVARLSGQEYKW